MEAKYGLLSKIQFCNKCVISNQRPNACVGYDHTRESKKETNHLDNNGVCDACNTTEKKINVDWDQREKELIELCDKHRSKDGSYDCLVPGSGGNDPLL